MVACLLMFLFIIIGFLYYLFTRALPKDDETAKRLNAAKVTVLLAEMVSAGIEVLNIRPRCRSCLFLALGRETAAFMATRQPMAHYRRKEGEVKGIALPVWECVSGYIPIISEEGKFRLVTEQGVVPMFPPEGGEVIYGSVEILLALEAVLKPLIAEAKDILLVNGLLMKSYQPDALQPSSFQL